MPQMLLVYYLFLFDVIKRSKQLFLTRLFTPFNLSFGEKERVTQCVRAKPNHEFINNTNNIQPFFFFSIFQKGYFIRKETKRKQVSKKKKTTVASTDGTVE